MEKVLAQRTGADCAPRHVEPRRCNFVSPPPPQPFRRGRDGRIILLRAINGLMQILFATRRRCRRDVPVALRISAVRFNTIGTVRATGEIPDGSTAGYIFTFAQRKRVATGISCGRLNAASRNSVERKARISVIRHQVQLGINRRKFSSVKMIGESIIRISQSSYMKSQIILLIDEVNYNQTLILWLIIH